MASPRRQAGRRHIFLAKPARWSRGERARSDGRRRRRRRRRWGGRTRTFVDRSTAYQSDGIGRDRQTATAVCQQVSTSLQSALSFLFSLPSSLSFPTARFHSTGCSAHTIQRYSSSHLKGFKGEYLGNSLGWWAATVQRGVNLFELFVKHQPGVAGCGWLQPGRNFLST